MITVDKKTGQLLSLEGARLLEWFHGCFLTVKPYIYVLGSFSVYLIYNKSEEKESS